MCRKSVSNLPDELLREILLQTTLIHGEWDVSTNYFYPGLFCSYDEYQITAWEHVLPDRLNITKVCRRWYQIGVEFLYGSFHRNRVMGRSHQSHLLSCFRAVLEARPELGYLIRRLSLDFDPYDNVDQVAIISLCPNIMIFSSLRVYATSDKWWTSTLFPSSLRQLDSSLSGPAWATVVAILNDLPCLEILHLYFHSPSPVRDPNYPTLSLPVLRVLQLYMHHPDVTSLQIFVARLHLPRLVALSFSSGASASHSPAFSTPFPAQVLGRLVSLNTWNHPGSTNAEDLACLRQVILENVPSEDLVTLIPHIPFHNVTHIILNPISTPPRWGHIYPWLSQFYDRMSFPLNPTTMPMLRILEIRWALSGIYMVIKEHSESAEILSLFSSLAAKFEQRGVQFIEAQKDVRKAPEPIKDIIKTLQKENSSLYSSKNLDDITRPFEWEAE
jgi:hypothetical protein